MEMTSEQKAEELKTKGNEEFKQGNYASAITYYSDALGTSLPFKPHVEENKNEAILTNRAASYTQIKKYTNQIHLLDIKRLSQIVKKL